MLNGQEMESPPKILLKASYHGEYLMANTLLSPQTGTAEGTDDQTRSHPKLSNPRNQYNSTPGNFEGILKSQENLHLPEIRTTDC